jgi:V/A-type H+-transporting ATPase subunit K
MWALAFIGLAAALAVGISALATAYAQRDIGSAAVGAMAENEALFGKGLIMTAIPETTVVFGFAIAFLLVGKLGDEKVGETLVKSAGGTVAVEAPKAH